MLCMSIDEFETIKYQNNTEIIQNYILIEFACNVYM